MAKRPGKPGKGRQSFTERDLRRAFRAAKAEQENRTVIIRRNGDIEMAPVSSEQQQQHEEEAAARRAAKPP